MLSGLFNVCSPKSDQLKKNLNCNLQMMSDIYLITYSLIIISF